MWLGVGIKHLWEQSSIQTSGGVPYKCNTEPPYGEESDVFSGQLSNVHILAVPEASTTEGIWDLKKQDLPSVVFAFGHPDESATDEAFKKLLISVACLLFASGTCKKI